jgi:multidrug efflux pump subunit AcrA (membrane-fusion protein)
MKTISPIALVALALLSAASTTGAEDTPSKDDTNFIPLDPAGVANLGIETEAVKKRDFETTVFAIGRIEEIPANRSVLSSRISGRAVEVNAFEGDFVKEGDVLVKVESRQPGNPPPTIELRAPKAGLVIESHVRVGEPVEPSTELLDISDRSKMWAIAKIPEREASRVGPGTEARIHIPALGETPISAKLLRYRVAADRQAGTVDGIFEIDNPDGKLAPGMRVEFSLIVSTRAGVTSVPRIAVQGGVSNRAVFIRHFDIPNAFTRVPVQLGEQNDRYVEILGGLFVGDEVVTEGSYSLGFAGTGTGISLKEALDAAHGHEHNEDGSELTPEQKAAKAAEAAGDHSGHDHGTAANSTVTLALQIYAASITLLFLIAVQQLWNHRRKNQTEATSA